MKQKYQNAIGFVVLAIILSLLPLLLLAQGPSAYDNIPVLSISKKIEFAVLQEIHQANPNNTFTKRWNANFYSNENVCELQEVTCNDRGLIIALDLSNRDLELLPSSIQSLENLKTLYLHGNSLESLPSSLGNLNSLIEVTFFDNNLERLDPKLRALCGINVRNGVEGNPLSRFMTWEEFCRGI